jgi:hypothetical protein
MITYPVNVATDRFTVKLGETVKRTQRWPRSDGMPIEGADPSLVVLQESTVVPAYDSSTQKLDNWRWVDDEQEQTATWTADVVDLTQAELDERADELRRAGFQATLAAGISTMREWADQMDAITVTSGNAVATVQNIVDNLPTFFRGFADLLEYMRIDK